jgi:hypothetical protein
LAEEGFVGVVTHDPRQTEAFDRFLLILLGHAPPPQFTDQQRLIGIRASTERAVACLPCPTVGTRPPEGRSSNPPGAIVAEWRNQTAAPELTFVAPRSHS